MIVAELEELLATLDKNTVVLVRGVHVQYISKIGARQYPKTISTRECNDCGRGQVREHEMVDVPPSIDLNTTIFPASIAEEAPKVKLHGRWSRAAKELFA